jgi:hypothetical protein
LKGSGLLFKDEYDLYVLTQYGSDYLDGETSPDSLSEHPPDLYTGHLNDSGRNFVSADSVELRHRVNFADRDVNDYSWGYRGHGPKALATALLGDVADGRTAEAHASAFMKTFVSKLDSDWKLSRADIQSFIDSQE